MKLTLSLLLLALLPSVHAEAPPLDAAARRQVGEAVANALETMYVIPETGKSLAAQIRAALASGAYDTATTPAALADALNGILRTANDRHLGVRYSEGTDGPRMRRPVERGSASGFRRVERLDGNIGYLDLGGFMSGDESRAAATAAMTLLASSDAVIIDLRRCPGGSAEAVNYLASYFFGPERRVLMNRYDRPTNVASESTTEDVPGRRMPETPLYILTSGRTVSACESFSYTLQQYGRARTVGERTAGAGYNNVFLPVGYGLRLSVSHGTATHPRSGKGWEAVGVQPDIAVPADRALDAARADALRILKRESSVAPPPDDAAAALAQVRRLEREWLDAYEKRDGEAMNRIVADDFTIVFPDGSGQSKADILASLERGRASGRPSPTFSTEDVQARAYGDTVVLTGRVITQSQNGRQESRYTDTYVRRGNGWQVVASHLSNVAAGPRRRTQ